YEVLTQRLLRAAITNALPDVAFQGLNRVQVITDQKIATPLDPFIAAEPNWKDMGYIQAMVDLTKVDGKVYGLPFAISTPVIFYNADLVRKAGGDPDHFPSDWPGIIALATKIANLPDKPTGMQFDYYDLSGNWTYIALVQGLGGKMMTDDRRS